MPDALPDQLISDEIRRQITDATSPETQVTYNLPSPRRADQGAIGDSTQNFEIRGGPADVTSYHDFYRLQIAFENIWTELLDSRVSALGQMLYQQYVQLKDFSGDNSPDPNIGSLNELRQLMDDIQKQSMSMDGSKVGIVIPPPPPSGGPPPIVVGDITTSVPPLARQTSQNNGELGKLLSDLDKLLATKYAFDVFAANSINFGILINYRQAWTPLNYQVGNLVSTIPLAPQEVRRYTTKTVTKKTRNVKEIDSALTIRKQESTETSRADSEIVQKALAKTNFQITASESFGSDETYKINSTQSSNQEQAKESAQTKKEFHESILKAAQEYKNEHRLEVTTDESTETETTAFHEIKNPNDELTVTYLLYELQRTYRVSEKLHKLTPVVLVANDVPAPNEITDSWLITHDWILKRAILDDSFLPALDYLSKSFAGAEVSLQILGINMHAQKETVDRIGQQVKAQNAVLQAAQANLGQAASTQASNQTESGWADVAKGIFFPLGNLFGSSQNNQPTTAGDQALVDAAKDALDRAQNAARQLMSQLETEMSALQAATNKFAAAVQEHFNQLTAVDRLRIHVKENILYYMQAIWSHEPPDQRYFRLYNLDVPVFTHHTMVGLGAAKRLQNILQSQNQPKFTVNLPVPAVDYDLRKLSEVADLDNLLGFKGNYMIFPLKEYNYLAYFMMQDYLDVDQIVRAKDPDEFGNFNLDELEAYMADQYANHPAQFEAKKAQYKALMIEYLSEKPSLTYDPITKGYIEGDIVIVPTTSLYIEALPGTHPLLEDFKLIHRAIDVKKVQADVRHAELENARLASRVLKGNDEDPDIDKMIVVEGGQGVVVQP